MVLTRKMNCTPWRRFQAGTVGAKAWRRLDSSAEQSHAAGAHMHRKLVMESERRVKCWKELEIIQKILPHSMHLHIKFIVIVLF